MEATNLFLIGQMVCLVAISGCINQSNGQNQTCGIESCHGLNISCGPKVPEVCTEIYMFGDRCRKFAKCEIIDGKCQQAPSAEFENCKSCVESCQSGSVPDPINSSGCESKCDYSQQLIGGQRDEHGCLGPAGYSWDPEVGACIRPWELKDADQKKAAKIAIAPMSYYVTVTSVEALNCTGCFIVNLQRNDNQNQFEIELENWTYKQAQRTILPANDSPTEDQICASISSGGAMELKEALIIASASECTKNGALTDHYTCNNNTGTWWIDLDLPKEGCNPACVVNIENKTAEINWRCTGLLPQ